MRMWVIGLAEGPARAGDELRASRRLQREGSPSPFVCVSERGIHAEARNGVLSNLLRMGGGLRYTRDRREFTPRKGSPRGQSGRVATMDGKVLGRRSLARHRSLRFSLFT
jgi:hypothetical protein